MKTKRTPTRRRFAHAWDEIRYLRLKVLHWLYDRQQPARARPFAKRLQELLDQADADEESIMGQECRALLGELDNNLRSAIAYRESEIRKIKQLHQSSKRAPQWDAACKDYGPDALSDRLDLLAALHEQLGETRTAIRVLEESRDYCRQQGIVFASQDALDELKQLQLAGNHKSKSA
jgi:hypothetical protein